MCKDCVTGEYIRADHLVKFVLEARLRQNAEARQHCASTDQSRQRTSTRPRESDLLGDYASAQYEYLLGQVSTMRCLEILLELTGLSSTI